jgi:hypothetical protein
MGILKKKMREFYSLLGKTVEFQKIGPSVCNASSLFRYNKVTMSAQTFLMASERKVMIGIYLQF